jgi:hypothetical protein
MAMLNPRPLKDEVYGAELDRMRAMVRFPELPALRQQMIRVMRSVTNNRDFLHALITYFVDHGEQCPTPTELSERANVMRASEAKPQGNPACEKCGGTGWAHGTKMVTVAGMPPYEAEYSGRCSCASGVRQAAG